MNTKSRLIQKMGTWLATLIVIASLIMLPGGTVGKTESAVTASYLVQGETFNLAAGAVTRCGGQVTSQLSIIETVGAVLSAGQLGCVKSQAGVVNVTANAGVITTGEFGSALNGDKTPVPATDYPDVTGADLVWGKGKETGKHVTVAIVDTGIVPLDGLDAKRIVAWKDFVDGSKKPVDPNGHGTHVAGVIANSQEGVDHEANGMAPDVDLVVARVLKQDGSGTYENVIQGIQWVIQNKEHYNIRVLNLSLVAPAQSAYWADPLNRAVTTAWASGITVVVSAGNSGPTPMTISVPGNNPYAITVGAFTDAYTPLKFGDDYIAPFSAAGPTLDGFTKPDVVAPGGHIVSTMQKTSYVAVNGGATAVAENYYSMAGTSQSAAVVSGVAALMISQNSHLTPNQIKYRMLATALPWYNWDTKQAVYSIWQQGHGRINAPDAVFAKISGEANLGMDIRADLAGKTHYAGYSYYDAQTATFRLKGAYANLDGGYATWNGQYSPATGAIGAWSGAIGAWSGAIGAWSGAIGAWSGGYTTWAGGAQAWTGSEPWSNLGLSTAGFVRSYAAGAPVDTATTISTCQTDNPE